MFDFKVACYRKCPSLQSFDSGLAETQTTNNMAAGKKTTTEKKLIIIINNNNNKNINK